VFLWVIIPRVTHSDSNETKGRHKRKRQRPGGGGIPHKKPWERSKEEPREGRYSKLKRANRNARTGVDQGEKARRGKKNKTTGKKGKNESLGTQILISLCAARAKGRWRGTAEKTTETIRVEQKSASRRAGDKGNGGCSEKKPHSSDASKTYKEKQRGGP